jgi:hypothetical protein
LTSIVATHNSIVVYAGGYGFTSAAVGLATEALETSEAGKEVSTKSLSTIPHPPPPIVAPTPILTISYYSCKS